MKSLVTIIRHGETEWNVAMRLQGNSDSALTEKGLKQAELAAKALQSLNYDVLISSNQKRALRTAEIINQYQGLTILENGAFRERNFGIMEGLTREEIVKNYPDEYDRYKKRRAEFQIPEGESLVQFYQRVTDGLNQISSMYQGKKILLVTHGGVLDCALRMTLDIPLGTVRKFSIYNAAINTFSFSENQWILEEWGNINHFTKIANSRVLM
jgi:probable phosphoglycerate mutase